MSDKYIFDKDENLVGRVTDTRSTENGAGIGMIMYLAAIPAPCIVWKMCHGVVFGDALNALFSPMCWFIDVVFWAAVIGIPVGLLKLYCKGDGL